MIGHPEAFQSIFEWRKMHLPILLLLLLLLDHVKCVDLDHFSTPACANRPSLICTTERCWLSVDGPACNDPRISHVNLAHPTDLQHSHTASLPFVTPGRKPWLPLLLLLPNRAATKIPEVPLTVATPVPPESDNSTSDGFAKQFYSYDEACTIMHTEKHRGGPCREATEKKKETVRHGKPRARVKCPLQAGQKLRCDTALGCNLFAGAARPRRNATERQKHRQTRCEVVVGVPTRFD